MLWKLRYLFPIFQQTELSLECSPCDKYIKDINQVNLMELSKLRFCFENQSTKTWQVSKKRCVNTAQNGLQLTTVVHCVY